MLYVTGASAQQISVFFTPILNEIAVKPGQSIDLQYRLNNNGDPAIIKLRILPFEPEGNSGNIKIISSLQSPIEFSLQHQEIQLEKPFFLQSSTSKQFNLNIAIPEYASGKDYYFGLVAETQPPPLQEGAVSLRSKTSVISKILLMVTKDGSLEIKPQINLFEVVPTHKINLFGMNVNLIDSLKPIPVVLSLDNIGNNLIKARGEIILRGPFWQSKSIDFKPKTILARSQRQTKIEFPGKLIGNYRLSANLSFGEGTPTVFASTSLTVLPVKITIFLFTIISLLLLYIRLMHKRYYTSID
ncbi:hypothetical protein A2774_04760 [Candidatus Roizmanbacteria bacterium RIFCSPHIGHO2_01_FULL_39_12c]|uniref:Uncharacterized protein n=1 Tax=Candidatus Roizmanbacteria bacterium RIFCSPHIGHO2_01_FULL_39_12c TaxID=1802031 RepID=A0A1F7GFA6_9BACT|nr:MAG: hypothetical protein A2774_04760 [Candidatus Roizmanbacteria bacterium RIFCSPHIGHO2_01_FULL_39_12c]OGK46240.1 MAG: hypothetical protein A2963_02115 [Candidatus Roizmanbacteria bacterium RIFCSPLOWO2_01_FULL_40_13]